MPTLTTDLKNTAGIVTESGSDFAMLKEVDSAGAELVDSAWFSAPIRGSITLGNDVTENTISGEGGTTYNLTGGETTRTAEMTILQRDSATKNFLRYQARGKYFTIIAEANRTAIDSEIQYDVFPICKISETWTEERPGTEQSVTWNILNNDSEITVDVTGLTIGATGFKEDISLETVTVPADQGHTLLAVTAS